MNKLTLPQAVVIISRLNKISESDITFIEFEDGSGRRFNYKTVKGYFYIDLSKYKN